MPDRIKKQRFAALAVLLLVLFSYPLLSIADKNRMLAGFPMLYLYIFLAWAIGIYLLYRAAEKDNGKKGKEP
ncbi:MAG TPA: hypothetical protein DCQ34_03420 [Chitinophagaceae bacterium]|nr:hypothetical protein [Chitinophagaceae bacterium]HCY89531.1 hypothetical protein [Chitinophagaceae bacterium]HRF26073.1 hypothetical protein [Ferruginibacter sp.]